MITNIARVHMNGAGELEACKTVDSGPQRLEVCLICGGVYLQMNRLDELRAFHHDWRSPPTKELPATSLPLVSGSGHYTCQRWYMRLWNYLTRRS